jgi:hypothetical protein
MSGGYACWLGVTKGIASRLSRDLLMLRRREGGEDAQRMRTVYPAVPSSMEVRDKGWGAQGPGRVSIWVISPAAAGQTIADNRRCSVRNRNVMVNDHEVQGVSYGAVHGPPACDPDGSWTSADPAYTVPAAGRDHIRGTFELACVRFR